MDPDFPDSWMEAGIALLGIPAEPDWLPAIRTHLEVTLRLGLAVLAHPIPDEADPAPVFRA